MLRDAIDKVGAMKRYIEGDRLGSSGPSVSVAPKTFLPVFAIRFISAQLLKIKEAMRVEGEYGLFIRGTPHLKSIH